MKKLKGFTLVEIMVVVALIAILTAVIIPNVSAIRARSRDSARISDISQIRLALEHYFNINKKYPIELSGITSGGVLTTLPMDPSAGSSYYYIPYCEGASYEEPTGFHLGAKLEQKNDVLNGDADGLPRDVYCNGYSGDFNGTTAVLNSQTNGEDVIYDFVNN